MKKNKINVVYGEGPEGTLAAYLIKLFSRKRTVRYVSRFYGTFLADKILHRDFLGIFLNWDICLAFKLVQDRVIITNDGTRGDIAVKTICPENLGKMRFWVNGVDLVEKSSQKHIASSGITVSRLVSWKHVDRVIRCVAKVVQEYRLKDFMFHVVGDGDEMPSLKCLAQRLGVANNVVFHGALLHDETISMLMQHNIFISTYDISNVGNPLLEAIRANKYIFTLNNGDTSSWIVHRKNGFIYDLDNSMIDRMASDIVELVRDPRLQSIIHENIKNTERERLWTWDERLQTEFSDINELSDARSC